MANEPGSKRAATPVRWAGIAIAALLATGALGWAAGGAFGPSAADRSGAGARSPGHSGDAAAGGGSLGPTIEPTATPTPPLGGTDLYGYLPYWEMNATIAAYLDQVPVTTLALFSVSAGLDGGIRHNDIGYKRITGPIGQGIIADAHARGQHVELVFTSFGAGLNASLLGSSAAAVSHRGRAVQELVALAVGLRVDGVNVDVEEASGDVGAGYTAFMTDLHAGLTAAIPGATLSAATGISHDGALLAADALSSGANRIFLMGYNYHWSGSGPGASAPIHNKDLGLDLMQSIADYVDSGVPRTRILLGLPLYGMSWPVAGPDLPDVVIGRGVSWIPADHASDLSAPTFSPTLDSYEMSDSFLAQSSDGWLATYYDSPRTLLPKLELARSQGLAGAGFWALGYDHGVPGYLDLMTSFRAGKIGGG